MKLFALFCFTASYVFYTGLAALAFYLLSHGLPVEPKRRKDMNALTLYDIAVRIRIISFITVASFFATLVFIIFSSVKLCSIEKEKR